MKRKNPEWEHQKNLFMKASMLPRPRELIEDDTAWSPYLSPGDAHKLDAVRLALRRGDIAEAAKHGRVFELTPVAEEQLEKKSALG